jgi:peptidyl-prolyl cis-trans isomerase B (cyclophilin B)
MARLSKIGFVLFGLVLAVACGSGEAPPSDSGTAPAASGAAPADVGSNLVEIRTSMGTMKAELYPDKAPATVENFLKYANEGFYDGTIFHRVIKGFMIQGGGFTPDMTEKDTHPPIQNEADNGLKNGRGTLAMARTSEPHSASSQFFINTKDNAFLDHSEPTLRGWGYAVFGKVVEGLDVLDKIESVSTGSRGGQDDVPTDPVVIESIRVLH